MNRAYVVIDTETTGFPGAHPAVGALQLGAVLVVAHPTAGTWYPADGVRIPVRPLQWPPDKCWQGAERVHGIPRARAERHPETPRQGYDRLMAWVGIHQQRLGGVPVYPLAWNAKFDVEILARAAGSRDVHFPDAPIRPNLTAPGGCLLKAWRAFDKAQPGEYRAGTGTLSRVAEALGIKNHNAHDALGDALVAALVLIGLLGKPSPA